MNAEPAALDSSRGHRLVEAYEHLRHAATTSLRQGPNLQGLGILIGKGMASWMQACAAVTPSKAPPTPPSRNAVQVPATVQRDVVDVLVAMALTIPTEVRT